MSVRAARKPVELSKELLRDLLEMEMRIQAHSRRGNRIGDYGHVYVVRFTTGVVKVGKAVDPRSRIAHHATQARIHGVDIADSWSSERHAQHSKTETELIAYCVANGARIACGKEYFAGLSFEVVRDQAAQFAAVGGDEDKTWEEAQAALDGSA